MRVFNIELFYKNNMRSTKWFTYLLFSLLYSTYLFSQDTVSVYFSFGSSKIEQSQYDALHAIPVKYDLSDLDSVRFVGATDSVGKLSSNLKLSEKRAKNVAKYCTGLFPAGIRFTVVATGEKSKQTLSKSRNVDILLFFKTKATENTIEKADTLKTSENCRYIDYQLLHRCHARTITKGKKEFILLETNINNIKKDSTYYTASENKAGKIINKLVKWEMKSTGNLWWQKTRFTALIPKKDFDKYKIFRITKPPCKACNEDFEKGKKFVNEDTCIQVDRFLMYAIQYKTTLFNRTFVNIRAPREYVDTAFSYYIGCGFNNKLVWETKKGRRKKNYYYTRLPLHLNYIDNITRTMNCCKSAPEPSECGKAIIQCATLGTIDKSITLGLEAGNYYQQRTNYPYLGLGISKAGDYSQVMLLFAKGLDRSYYGSFRYQYNFLSFPFSAINPFSTWKSPGNVKVIYKYCRLYAGTEFKTRVQNAEQNYFEQNLHLGLSIVNTERGIFIQRFFVQCGIGLDYLRKNSSGPYPIFQIGMNMKLLKFYVERKK